VAIVQISRIQNRKGLQVDLPQLAGAELGWSVDERRLFIGNGTLEEGAPVVGNTEIRTEFSDILAFQTTYTYKGLAAGYEAQTGPAPNTPVTQSLQSWLDQWASVKDFGAVGDGVTDDTAAINRALYQLFCREINPQIRRSLFFPAGVYKVSETIIIPPYATLYGEGADNSVISMAAGDDSALRAYVARTGDSLQQTGSNIGSNGAIVPQYVTISNLGFETEDTGVDVFLVQDATNCKFESVNFLGPLTKSGLTTSIDNIAGVRFASSASLVCQSITFDKCTFSGLTYGINTDQQIQGITVSNSRFDTLYQGVVLASNSPVLGGPNGFRVLHNFFNNIYAQGVYVGAIQLNATGYNIFYDVGNHFNGSTSPATSIIYIGNANNICVADMFERGDSYSLTYPRIDLSGTSSIGFVNGEFIELGPNVIRTAPKTVLTNNVSNQTLYSFGTAARSTTMNYSITRDTGVRHGSFRVVPTGGGLLTYDDDYVEDQVLGVTLSASESGGIVSIQYSTNNTGIDGSITFSISTFRI
jgi:hypothetical protein